MGCERRFPDDMLARYVLGELGERQRRTVEDHFFECASCLERVEILQALPRALDPARGPARTTAWAMTTRPRAWKRVLTALGGVAAAVVLGLIVRPGGGLPAASPSPVVAEDPLADSPAVAARELGRFSPPPYAPLILRSGGEGEARTQALQPYVAGDYAAAITALEALLRRAPRDPAASFFLGVSYLMEDRTEEGLERLHRTVALGDTPYLEEAHFYLAIGHLRSVRLDPAIEELERVVALHGDREDEAGELLQRAKRLRDEEVSPPQVP